MAIIKAGFVKAAAFNANSIWGGGAGSAGLSGTVSVNGAPARRPVRLHEAASGLLLAAQWSAVDGSYAFSGLSADRLYQVVASDYPAFTYADRAARQIPGVWSGLDVDLIAAPGDLAVAIGPGDYAGWPFSAAGRDHLKASVGAANTLWGGADIIAGAVTRYGAPFSTVVRLYEQSTGQWTGISMRADGAGRFAFSGLTDRYRYSVRAVDYPAATLPDGIASNLLPASGAPPYYADGGQIGLIKKDSGQLQINYGGSGVVAGPVKIGTVPVRRIVSLLDARTMAVVRRQWSAVDGSYRFEGLNTDYRYTAVASDFPDYSYNDVIAANITPV